jgi:hypothetical protein
MGVFTMAGHSVFTLRQRRPMRKQDKRCRLQLEVLEDRTLLSFNTALGDVFYIDMENHNLIQPSGLNKTPEQLLANPAAPYLNSLMTIGNPNAAQTSWASNYDNAGIGIHPSLPNYLWQEQGTNNNNYNDNQPFGPGGANQGNAPNLSGLLQIAGIPWKSYQEDIDLTANSNNYAFTIVTQANFTAGAVYSNNGQMFTVLQTLQHTTALYTSGTGAPAPSGILTKISGKGPNTTSFSAFGTVNVPAANALTSTIASQDQWTVPLTGFSGTSSAYTNSYNGSNQYNFQTKHDGQLYFNMSNGGNNPSPSNPESLYYAPLQQLATDLTNNTVARYSQITPDQYNDMHSSLNTAFTYNGVTYAANTDQEAIALGDNFLSMIVPQIMASQAYKNNGAIVIWFDETEFGDTSKFTLPLVVISPLAKGNAYNSTLTYTHSSDLKTMEELFGVYGPGGAFLGGANNPATNDLSDFFVTSSATANPVASGRNAASVLGDVASMRDGLNATGNLAFMLTEPDGWSSQTGKVTGGNALTNSTVVPGAYVGDVSYGSDANNSTHEQSIIAAQLVHKSDGDIIADPLSIQF